VPPNIVFQGHLSSCLTDLPGAPSSRNARTTGSRLVGQGRQGRHRRGGAGAEGHLGQPGEPGSGRHRAAQQGRRRARAREQYRLGPAAACAAGAAQVWCQLMLETLDDPAAPWRSVAAAAQQAPTDDPVDIDNQRRARASLSEAGGWAVVTSHRYRRHCGPRGRCEPAAAASGGPRGSGGAPPAPRCLGGQSSSGISVPCAALRTISSGGARWPQHHPASHARSGQRAVRSGMLPGSAAPRR
jgi:hypothetical protein